MFLNLLNQNNYGSYNITLAKMFGLEASAYCSALLTIYDKAKRKNKLVENDFVKVDRKYIEERTTLSVEKQLEIDARWESINIIVKSKNDINTIKINTELIVSLIEGKEPQLTESVAYVKNTSKKEIRELKRTSEIENIKSKIVCNDPEILFELKRYVDATATLDPRKGNLTQQSVEIFQEEVTNFAGNNKAVLKELIRIGTKHKAIDGDWVIRRYSKGQKELTSEETFVTKSSKPIEFSDKKF